MAILAPNLKFMLIGPQYEVIEGWFAKETFLEKFHLDHNKFLGCHEVPVSLVGPQYEQEPDKQTE